MTNNYGKILASSAALAAGVFLAQGAVSADQVTVKAGDTLSAYATQYNTTVDALAKHNNIADANKILVGQTIDTDAQNDDTAAATPTTVTVKASDTLSSLADTYKTTVQQIKQDNGLASDLIYVGQQLKINPAGTASQSAPAQVQTAQQTAPQQQQAPVQQAPVQQAPAQQSNNSGYQMRTYQPTVTAQQQNAGATNYTSGVAGNDAAAKAWIAGRESGGNYNARNGQYIGKYQLSSAYLNGDYSPANQERVADNYVAQRYGSWSNAQRFWQNNGWY